MSGQEQGSDPAGVGGEKGEQASTGNASRERLDQNNASQASAAPETALAGVITQVSPTQPTFSLGAAPAPVANAAIANPNSAAAAAALPASASVSSTADSSKVTVESTPTPTTVPISQQQPTSKPLDAATPGPSRPTNNNIAQGGTGTGTATQARRARPDGGNKKKKKGGLAKFFAACLPCGAASAYEDEEDHDEKKRPTTTSPAAPTKLATVTDDQRAQSSSIDEKAALAAGDAPVSTAPGTANEENARLASAAVAANTSPAGVSLPRDETAGVTSAAVMAPGKEAPGQATPVKSRRKRSGRGGPNDIITSVPEPGAESSEPSSESDSDDSDEDDEDEDEEDEEQALIARGGVGIPIGEDGLPHPLLAEIAADMKGRKCLVLDLDETLVHSSFKMVQQADYVVPVEIESQYHNVFVIKRPGVDAFLKAMGDIYEVVVFTASLSKYADPVLDHLDVHNVVKHRLFRESCYNNKGNYVKDLSQLGRPMADCIIIDNSPASYVFHQHNAVPISSWFNDPHDTELTDLVPFLSDLHEVDDVRSVLDARL